MKLPRFHIKNRRQSGSSPESEVLNTTTSNEEFMPKEEVVTTEEPKAEPLENDTASIVDEEVPQSAEAVTNQSKSSEEATSILSERVSINAIFACIWRNKWKYVLPIVLTGVLASWIALCIPRYYKVTVMLAPEYNQLSGSLSSSLGGIASSIGLDVGSMGSADAIVPMFYPDLLESTDFLVPLFGVKVKTKDGKYTGTYSDYLKNHQIVPWWRKEINKLQNRIAPPPVEAKKAASDTINPFALTYTEDAIVRAIKGSIDCSVDKKTDVITITTQAQDPLVAALIADTVRERLQNFIIEYRTLKARRDVAHIQMQCDRAHEDYLKKQKQYATFVDANQDLVLETFKAKERDLEDEMQLAFTSYSSLLQRLNVAKAKVEERTPVFTTLQNASVPVRHAGPKRVLIVLGSLIAAFILTTIVLISRDKNVKW